MAEDMEGFGVALACRLLGVPLAIVRGISNEAGDREHARWQVPAALAAAADLAVRVLEESP
jgi:futalosine hydrolase